MANATAITVNALTADSSITLPTPDTLDTGTAAVTIPAASIGDTSRRCILLVKNTDDDTALTAKINKGSTNPPAFRTGVGDLSVSVAFGVTKVIGPFEPARFIQSDGSLSVTITPASGTISAQLTLLQLPKTV